MSLPERNDPCPCGSGKKYKKCCLGKAASATSQNDILLRQAEQHHLADRLAEAETLYREVLQSDPHNYVALHRLGLLAHKLGHQQAALELISEACRLHPADPALHCNKGMIQQALNNLGEAEASYRQALVLKPNYVRALANLGAVYSHQGRLAEALHYYRMALDLEPAEADIMYNIAFILGLLGDVEAAMTSYHQVISINPNHPEAHNNLAYLLIDQGRLDEAVTHCHMALAAKSDLVQAYNNLGIAYFGMGKLAEAVKNYQIALSLKPDYTEAHCNLGNAYQKLSRFEDAILSYRKALALKMDYIEAQRNLGIALIYTDQIDEAITCLRQALALKPVDALSHLSLASAFMNQGESEAALASSGEAVALKPDDAAAYDTWLGAMLYLRANGSRDIYVAHRRYAEQFETPLMSHWPVHAKTCVSGQRIKVGYVSPDFRQHSVAYFIEPILAHHDKALFEIHLYYTHALSDAVTERMRGYADHWVDCFGWSDERLADRIRADSIEILVDLAGHTGDNRLLCFARKPAPVQVTYLGYPATTGLSAIDYRLVSNDTDPLGSDAWNSEQLYRLPRSLWCYRPERDMPAVVPELPARRNSYVTFSSMNKFAKISPEVIALWADILQKLPTSRLIMTNIPSGSVRQRLLDSFTAHDISSKRITLYGALPSPSFRAILADIDIALDPFPYNGTTTTCNALWMGIPIISLIGQTSVSRCGYALLKTINLAELAARDEDSYVRIALELARDIDRLDELRRGMRARLETSPLRDEAGLTRDIEAAYRAMWQAWCAGGTEV